jgi:hypothetical protein
LEQRFNLTWLEHASIIKSDHPIWIRYRTNFISIELDLDKEAATMKIKEQRKQSEYQLAVRAISPDFLSVRAPIMPIKANAAHYLLLSTQQHIPSFLFDLASKVLPGSSEFEILSRDQKFRQSLEKIKAKFDSKYKTISKRKVPCRLDHLNDNCLFFLWWGYSLVDCYCTNVLTQIWDILS